MILYCFSLSLSLPLSLHLSLLYYFSLSSLSFGFFSSFPFLNFFFFWIGNSYTIYSSLHLWSSSFSFSYPPYPSSLSFPFSLFPFFSFFFYNFFYCSSLSFSSSLFSFSFSEPPTFPALFSPLLSFYLEREEKEKRKQGWFYIPTTTYFPSHRSSLFPLSLSSFFFFE